MRIYPRMFIQSLLGQPWAMEPNRLRWLVTDLVTGAHEVKGAIDIDEGESDCGYEVRNGVAHVAIRGPILKSLPWIFKYFGIEATGTVEASSALDAAMCDPNVASIQLDIDSPGGTVAGVQSLADKVHAIAQGEKKPVRARVEDLAASAAYWIASQAQSIEANPSAMVGSIGVYTVVDDISKLFERAGIKTHVISSHELKGTGVQGAPVSAEQLKDIKRNIMDFMGLFEDAVSRGRDLTGADLAKVTTGQVWIASDAMSLGLIDSIGHVTLGDLPMDEEEKKDNEEEEEEEAEAEDEAEAEEEEDEEKAEEEEDEEKAEEEDEDEEEEEEDEEQASFRHRTPQAAKRKGMKMDKKKALGASEASKEIKALRAELEAQKAVNAAIREQQINALLEKHADRIPPKSRDAVAKAASFKSTLEEVEEMLVEFPVFTRSERVTAEIEKASNHANFRADEVTKARAKLAEIPTAQLRKIEAYGEHVEYVKMNGNAVLYDGREVTPDEIDGALGLN